ncbi:hypothetical protein N7478_007777 [Penicillium angulare]|uniref:uncharacterized protein n=1 Tax=Penicillium angulare TaxID=116970 RepID=UPI0025406933|nr:uncharacterized protein N7478_007777 [Penicillium angulare]KAJ5272652.1 hypothetical protein N7478_007777 [Penicillium angulare]
MAPHQPPSPHVGVILNPSARRVACDQCHAQKLRCTKLENSNACVRCQRLSRQCVWSPPSRSGRPARGLDHTDKRGKRSFSVFEMTPEADSHLESAREPSLPTPNTLTHPQPAPIPVGISEAPPSGTPSIADCNMSDLFNFGSPHDSSRESLFPPLWTPDSLSQIPSMTDYFQMPPGPQTGVPLDVGTPPRLESLQDITRELSSVNMALFDVEQSLYAEPWGSMFASPAAVITKLSNCAGGQPDDTLTQGYPLTDAFNKTQRFINIAEQTSIYLASLPNPPSSSLISSSLTSSSPIDQETPDSETSSQGSSPFFPPVDLYMSRYMPSQFCTSSSDRPRRTASPDLPTALLFTTGYARILDIYMTVVTQMSNFVHAISVQSMNGAPDYRQRMHPVIPPLQWGGFQPANYGALQILMVIQVISYSFTQVERVLGVEEWERELTRERSRSEERRSYRFAQSHGQSRRRDTVGDGDRVGVGNGTGLLSPAMIALVFQEEGEGSRRGKVGLLRRKLRRLKKDLEKSMHI